MFIIPVGNRVDWKRPPVVTLLLILINCFVFFVLQGADNQNDEKAMQYYFSSDLPKWELDRYAIYLKKETGPVTSEQFEYLLEEKDTTALLILEQDDKFMHELHAGHIVTPQAPEYGQWLKQRTQYESLQSFTRRYVAQVDHPDPLKILVSTFMHGSFDHLLGNMVVLFLIGFLVESVIGKTLFTFAYIGTAYTAEFMYILTAEPGSSGLGASGAIAGIMGLYTVIFGLRKIDFFYSLGFYFDYVRAPALILLPLWLGNELYQYWTDDQAHVAYMAHFGGLLGGAAIGTLYRIVRPALIKEHHHAVDSKEMDAKEFQRGMDLLGAMEFQKALSVFKALQVKHPDDMNIMRLVYRAAKSNPASDDYHQTALSLLALPEMDEATSDQTHAIFKEYLNAAMPSPKISQNLAIKLAKRFADNRHLVDAEKLTNMLQRTTAPHKDVPSVMLALARGYYREQQKDKFEKILQSLIHQFPESQDAEVARGMLRVG